MQLRHCRIENVFISLSKLHTPCSSPPPPFRKSCVRWCPLWRHSAFKQYFNVMCFSAIIDLVKLKQGLLGCSRFSVEVGGGRGTFVTRNACTYFPIRACYWTAWFGIMLVLNKCKIAKKKKKIGSREGCNRKITLTSQSCYKFANVNWFDCNPIHHRVEGFGCTKVL